VTDKNIILHRGQEIATVEEAQVLCAETESKIGVSKKTNTLPKHIEELFRLSTEGLDKNQKSEIKTTPIFDSVSAHKTCASSTVAISCPR
jgi:hypothetical protein